MRIAKLLLFLATTSIALLAQPEGLLTVGSLAKQAKIVVVGRLTPLSSAMFSLAVERTLEGNISPGTTTRVQRSFFSEQPSCPSELRTTESAYGLWFLVTLPNGDIGLSPEPKSQSCNPLAAEFEIPTGSPPAEWSYSISTPLPDKLAYELAWSVAAHSGDGPFGFVKNSQLLSGASPDVFLDIHRKFFDSHAQNVQLYGLLGLVKVADPAALAILGSRLTQVTSTPLRTSFVSNGKRLPIIYGPNGDEHPTFESSVAGTISDITDSSASTVTALGKILDSKDASLVIRRSAANALQNIHTSQTLPFLAPLLEDSDPELRALAIGGLSCFANGVPIVVDALSIDLNRPSRFKNTDTILHFAMGVNTIGKKEAFYLDFWRSWWAKNQAAVYSATLR